MDRSAPDAYLETQVNTATPQRLRLMLIEAALRHLRTVQPAWTEGRKGDACEALIRSRDIVTELLSGIKPDSTPLVQQTLGIYVFLFSAITEVQQSRDAHQLAGIIRVLEEERETWHEVCLAVPHRVVPDQTSSTEELAPQRVGATFEPSYGATFAGSAAAAESLSIEA